jgi:hypothetical protein
MAVTVEKLREWRGVKPVADPAGVAITTRLRATPADISVLNAVASHLGRLRRADLAMASRPVRVAPGLDDAARRQDRRDRLNSRKQALTAQSSSRWANAIIGNSDSQYHLSRDGQARHIIGLRAAISTIEKRLAEPTADTLTPEQQTARRRARLPKGYPTQAERFQKQLRLQHLRAELTRLTAAHANRRVHIVEGGRQLARTRHHLGEAGLTLDQWQEQWGCARWRIEANGSGDEPFGNLTITVTPDGQVSLRLPRPLEHLANAPRGRYVLSDTANFAHRQAEWRARITGGRSVSYTISCKPHRAGVYLTGAWATSNEPTSTTAEKSGYELPADGPIVAVDLNDGHLAVRRLDRHGNPVGRANRIGFTLTGSSARRDAQVRHAITRLIHHAHLHGYETIAVEDLDFADARDVGRETMGRGRRGKRFRRSVAGIPTAVFRNRLAAMTSRAGLRLLAVNPAYTSAWGDQHWRKPYVNVTRHEAAATVIGRRAQGHKARRREGVTLARPEDRAVRATNQAEPREPRATTGGRHRTGMRGNESRPPDRPRTRPPGRATVSPAPANPGQAI